MTTIGLVIIVLAWLYQLVMLLKKNHNLQNLFVAGYALGVLLLVVDGYRTGISMIASLNLLALLAAVFALILNKK
ncbi:MAG: hypothetical protein PHV78_00360 [Patescibacteria group bacterium]|nr:hypothetical protein [Patescibacteria group bacterium]MDD5121375.1 hypothetical protein [Patescibacteria group bacterium]MDD5221782.1 hypothetical protein [Patescibacteria group bacterium]MDD5395706.1 hypothetical protein [Patescibacteria group bacterium]